MDSAGLTIHTHSLSSFYSLHLLPIPVLQGGEPESGRAKVDAVLGVAFIKHRLKAANSHGLCSSTGETYRNEDSPGAPL